MHLKRPDANGFRPFRGTRVMAFLRMKTLLGAVTGPDWILIGQYPGTFQSDVGSRTSRLRAFRGQDALAPRFRAHVPHHFGNIVNRRWYKRVKVLLFL